MSTGSFDSEFSRKLFVYLWLLYGEETEWTEDRGNVYVGRTLDFFDFTGQLNQQTDVIGSGVNIGFFFNDNNSDARLTAIQDFLSPYISLNDDFIPNLNPSVYLQTDITFNDVKEASGDSSSVDETIINTQLLDNLSAALPKTFSGDAGSDYIINFSEGRKWLNGGQRAGVSGNDVLVNIGEGYSLLTGGGGDDYLLNIASGINRLLGQEGNDTLFNIGGSSNVDDAENTLNGGSGDDILVNYAAGTNILEGGENDDILINLGDAATLKGEGGNDTLIVWAADNATYRNDILDGGTGTDTAVFPGNYADYQFEETTIDGIAYIAVSKVGSTDVDYLTSIERITFDDQTLDIASALAGNAVTNQTIGEYGSVSGLTHVWQTIQLDGTYVNPVVITSDPTFNGDDVSAVRLRNVDSDSFEIRIQEANYFDEVHPNAETISYFVVEAGEWELSDGTRIAAGLHDTSNLITNGNDFDSIDFTANGLTDFDSTPTVLSQAQTYAGTDWITTRVKGQSTTGFQVGMQEEELLNTGIHVEETVGWLAIDQGVSRDTNGDLLLQGGTTGVYVDENFDTVSFNESFDVTPTVIAKIGSSNGLDTAALRIDSGSISTNSFRAFVQEEQSLDAELGHVNESVSYLAFNGTGGLLTSALI
ncbi:MAG: calcium-binding protein [Leptolyngbya sp. SIO3F4]|nr:calcium-binding protein [Leptolyngbya sp. SIO3F4]